MKSVPKPEHGLRGLYRPKRVRRRRWPRWPKKDVRHSGKISGTSINSITLDFLCNSAVKYLQRLVVCCSYKFWVQKLKFGSELRGSVIVYLFFWAFYFPCRSCRKSPETRPTERVCPNRQSLNQDRSWRFVTFVTWFVSSVSPSSVLSVSSFKTRSLTTPLPWSLISISSGHKAWPLDTCLTRGSCTVCKIIQDVPVRAFSFCFRMVGGGKRCLLTPVTGPLSTLTTQPWSKKFYSVSPGRLQKRSTWQWQGTPKYVSCSGSLNPSPTHLDFRGYYLEYIIDVSSAPTSILRTLLVDRFTRRVCKKKSTHSLYLYQNSVLR